VSENWVGALEKMVKIVVAFSVAVVASGLYAKNTDMLMTKQIKKAIR
jgi:hypothetical protein